MAMQSAEILRYLKQTFDDAEIQIQDLAGDDNHFSVTIKSTAFRGKNRVQQHQMVYQALQGHVGTTLHALALTTIVKENSEAE